MLQSALINVMVKAARRAGACCCPGQGAPIDRIEGLKWHLVAKTAGKGD